VKQDVSIVRKDMDSHEDVFSAPLKHGLYHVSLLPSIHFLDQFPKHESYHVLVSHPNLLFLFLKHDLFPLEEDPPMKAIV